MDVLIPTIVGGTPIQLSVGVSHVCALDATGTVKCWGHGGSFQLGTQSSATQNSPTTTINAINVAQLATGNIHTMFRLANGQVWVVGGNSIGQLGIGNLYTQTSLIGPIDTTNMAVDICASNIHSCMVLVDGRVQCWGSNTYGQIGADSSTANKISPFTVPLNGRFAVKVSCGTYHTCAVFDDGTVNCWGMKLGHGQVGDPIPSSHYVVADRVVALGDGDTVKEIATGEAHTCIITNNDRLKCWGSNVQGELGIGHNSNIATPTYVLTLGKVKQLSTGSWSTCAVLWSGTLRCWGRNIKGESGYGTQVTDVHTPPTTNVNLGIGRTIKYIASGHGVSAYSRCAILDNDEVKCWGNGGDGQNGIDPKYPTYPTTNGVSVTGIGLWADRYSCNACASGTNVAGDVKLSGATTCDA
jgi:alpha-tubulin suppressor-like RCC1 family protein